MTPFNTRNWYPFLTSWQKQLVEVAGKLIRQAQKKEEYLVDYSYLVFPMSKAYEGFLKKFLYDFKLINKSTYEGKRFRIGRALNPDVAKQQRDQYWLYDDIARLCSDQTAQQLWDAWLFCRNRVFHFFPKDKGLLTLGQAIHKVERVSRAMSAAVACYHRRQSDQD